MHDIAHEGLATKFAHLRNRILGMLGPGSFYPFAGSSPDLWVLVVLPIFFIDAIVGSRFGHRLGPMFFPFEAMIASRIERNALGMGNPIGQKNLLWLLAREARSAIFIAISGGTSPVLRLKPAMILKSRAWMPWAILAWYAKPTQPQPSNRQGNSSLVRNSS
jgi:hypothetical protein